MKKEKSLILLKPNLGQPELINLVEFSDETPEKGKKVSFRTYFLSNIKLSSEDLQQKLISNVYIQPILKDSGDFLKRRGQLQKLEISKITFINLDELGPLMDLALNENELIIRDIYNTLLKINKGILKDKYLYCVNVQLEGLLKIRNLLEKQEQSFILFDLIYPNYDSTESLINYHSIAIFNKSAEDFNFIHATDLHIARRNDFISKHLRNKARKRESKSFHGSEINKGPPILERDFIIKKGFQEEKWNSLQFAKYNFNYDLRRFIKFANDKAAKKKLDFIILTGDLIDFREIVMGNDIYVNNFEVFISILLGVNKRVEIPPYLVEDEYLNQNEIMVPIFTTTGNHDYRIGHYSLYAGKIRKIFGMTKEDIKNYHDLKFFSYYNTIRSGAKYLRYYFENINPNLNYTFQFGEKWFFICLDTGEDSKINLYNLFRGAPKSKGLSNYQIELLKQFIKKSNNRKVIILMHAPPISPATKYYKQKKLKKLLNSKENVKWADLYEDNLNHLIGKRELNDIIDLNHQTIKNNRKNFLKTCLGCFMDIQKKVEIILCGHNHTIIELRIKAFNSNEKNHQRNNCNSIKFYTNKYGEIINSLNNNNDLETFFNENRPFIFQTQSLGPIAKNPFKFKPPGFRFISIIENQIKKIELYSLYLIKKK